METARVVIGYVRVSTVMQAADGVSLEAQRERIERWAGRPVEVFVDRGMSGSRADNRPELAKAMDAVCAAKGVLVVYSLSRWSRSTVDTLEMAGRLEKRGADLVSLTESIDTTSAAGKMLFRMLAVFAEFERDVVSERTKEGLALKRRRGERLGPIIRYGYRAKGRRHVEVDEHEQSVIRRMVELRDLGLSYRVIGDHLIGEGLKPRSGGVWTPKVIRDVLEREATTRSSVAL